MSLFFIFIFWKDYKNPKEDFFHLNDGNSVIWFLIFYIAGAYIGKYRADYYGIKKYIYCFIYLFIFSCFSFLFFKTNNNELPLRIGKYKLNIPITLKVMLNDKYHSFFKIVQSITFCLFFMQIHYNKYIAKIICFIGPLTFGIYLIHNHKLIHKNVLDHFFENLSRNLSFKEVLNSLLLESLKMVIFSLIIDYLRYLLFSLLRIKKILIFLETKLKEKLS